MGRAYSEDLRLQVLKALDGGMSKMATHRLFGISHSTLDDWLHLRRQTGSVAATVYRRGRLPALNEAESLHAFVQSQPVDGGGISMVAAWCQGQVMALWTFNGSCDAALFELWFQTQLLPQLKPGQVVILDNATFHRKKVLSQMLQEVGCSLLPLPAYSPDFNPIESLWHQIKHRIRHHSVHSWNFWGKVDAAFCSL